MKECGFKENEVNDSYYFSNIIDIISNNDVVNNDRIIDIVFKQFDENDEFTIANPTEGIPHDFNTYKEIINYVRKNGYDESMFSVDKSLYSDPNYTKEENNIFTSEYAQQFVQGSQYDELIKETKDFIGTIFRRIYSNEYVADNIKELIDKYTVDGDFDYEQFDEDFKVSSTSDIRSYCNDNYKKIFTFDYFITKEKARLARELLKSYCDLTDSQKTEVDTMSDKQLLSSNLYMYRLVKLYAIENRDNFDSELTKKNLATLFSLDSILESCGITFIRHGKKSKSGLDRKYHFGLTNNLRRKGFNDDDTGDKVMEQVNDFVGFFITNFMKAKYSIDYEKDISMPEFINMCTTIKQYMNKYPDEFFSYKDEQEHEKEITLGKLSANMLSNPSYWMNKILLTDDPSGVGITNESQIAIFNAFRLNREILDNIRIRLSNNVSFTAYDDICSTISNIDYMGYISADISSATTGAFLNHISNPFDYRDSMQATLTKRLNMNPNRLVDILKDKNLYFDPIQPQNGVRILYPVKDGLCTLTITAATNEEVKCSVTKRIYDKGITRDNFIESIKKDNPLNKASVMEGVTKFIGHAFGNTHEFNIKNFITGIKTAITQNKYDGREELSLIDDNVIKDYRSDDTTKKDKASNEISKHITQRLEVQRRSGLMFHFIAENVARILSENGEINESDIDESNSENLPRKLRKSTEWKEYKDETDESCKISFSSDNKEENIIRKIMNDVLSDFISEGFVEKNGNTYKLKDGYSIVPDLFIKSNALEKNGVNETRYDLNGMIDLIVVEKDKNKIKSVVLYDYKCSNRKSYDAYKDDLDMKSDATIKQLSLYKRMISNFINELGHVFDERNITTKVIGYRYEFEKPMLKDDISNWNLKGYSKLSEKDNSLELNASEKLQKSINSLIRKSDTNIFGIPYSVTISNDNIENVFPQEERSSGDYERDIVTDSNNYKEDYIILYKLASAIYGLSNNGSSDKNMIDLIEMFMSENGNKTLIEFANPALQSLLVYNKTVNYSSDRALYTIRKLCGDGYVKNLDPKSVMKVSALPVGKKNMAYYSDCMAIKNVLDSINGHTKVYNKSYSKKNIFSQKTSSWISSAKAHYFSETKDGAETVLNRIGMFRHNIAKEYSRYLELNGRNGVKEVSKMSRSDLFNLFYIRSLIRGRNQSEIECFVPNAQADKVEIPCVIINGDKAYASAKKAGKMIGSIIEIVNSVDGENGINSELLRRLNETTEKLNIDLKDEYNDIRFETVQYDRKAVFMGEPIFRDGSNVYDMYRLYSKKAADIYSIAERVETIAYYSYQLNNIYSDYEALSAYHGYDVMKDYFDKKDDEHLLQLVKQYNEDPHLERRISQLNEDIMYFESIGDKKNADKMRITLNDMKGYFGVSENESGLSKRNKRLQFIPDVHYGKGFDYAREYLSIMLNQDRYDQFKKEQMIISVNNLLNDNVRINSKSLGNIVRDTEKKTETQKSLRRFFDFFFYSGGRGNAWSRGSDINTDFVLFNMNIKSGKNNEINIPVFSSDDLTYYAPVLNGKRVKLDENVNIGKQSNDNVYFNGFEKETVIYGSKWNLMEFVIYKLKSADKDFNGDFSVEYELHPALKFLNAKQSYLENGFRLSVNGGITQFGKSIKKAPVRLSKDELNNFHFVLEGCIGTESKRNTKNSAPSFVFRHINEYSVPTVNDKVVANVSVIPDSEFEMALPFGDEYNIKTTDGVMFVDPVYFESLKVSSMSNATNNDVIKPYFSLRDRHTGTTGAVKCSGQNISYDKIVDSEGFMRLYKKMNSTISFKDAIEDTMMKEGEEYSEYDYEKFNKSLASSIRNNWKMQRYFPDNDINAFNRTGNRYLEVMNCEYIDSKVDIPDSIYVKVEEMLKIIIGLENFKKEFNEIKGNNNFESKYVVERILFESTRNSNNRRRKILDEIKKMSSDDENNEIEAYGQLYDNIIKSRVSNVFDITWGYKKDSNGKELFDYNTNIVTETRVINNPYDLFMAFGGTMMFDKRKRNNNVFFNMNEVLSKVKYAKLAIIHMANVVSSTKFGISNQNSKKTLNYDDKYKNGQSLSDVVDDFILKMGGIGINLDKELSVENFQMKKNGIIDAINRYEGTGDKTELLNLTEDIANQCDDYNKYYKLNYSQYDSEQFGIQGDYSDYTIAGESKSSLATQPTYLSGGTGAIAKLSNELRKSISYMIGTYIDKLYSKYPDIIGQSAKGKSFEDFKLEVLKDVAAFVWNGINKGVQETEFESILKDKFVNGMLSGTPEENKETVKSIMAETTSEVWAMVRDVSSMIERNGVKLRMSGDMDVLNVSHDYVKIHGWKRKSKWGIEYDKEIESAQNALLEKVRNGEQLSYEEAKCVHHSPCDVYIGETYYIIGTGENGEIIESLEPVTINSIDAYRDFVIGVESGRYGSNVSIVDDIVSGRNLRYDNYIFTDNDNNSYGIWDFRSSYMMYKYLRNGHNTTDDEINLMRDYLVGRPDIIIDRNETNIDVIRKRMQDAVQNDISSIMTEGAEVDVMAYDKDTMTIREKIVTLTGNYDYKPCECIMPEYYKDVFKKLLAANNIKSFKMLNIDAEAGEIVCMTSDGKTFIVSTNEESKYNTYDDDSLEVVGEMSTKHFKTVIDHLDNNDDETEREVNVPVICIGKDDKESFMGMLRDTGIVNANISESFDEGAFGFNNEELNESINSTIEENTNKLYNRINISKEVLRYIFCSRTPAQSKQSGMQMYVADYMDNNYNNVYVSALQLLLHGSDFDIDKITMYLFELNKKTGKIMLWSDFSNYDSVENVRESMKLPLPEKISLSFDDFKSAMIINSQKVGKWKESFIKVRDLIGDNDMPSGEEADMENWKTKFDTKEKLSSLADFIYDVREDDEVFRCEMSADRDLANVAASLYYSFNLKHDIKKEEYQTFFVQRIQTIYSHPQVYHEVHTPVDIYGSVKRLNDENKSSRNNAGSGPGCMGVTLENIQRAQEGAGTIGYAATASKVLHAFMNVLNDFSTKDATVEEVKSFFINTNFDVKINGKDYRNIIGAVKIAMSPDMISFIDEKYRNEVAGVFESLERNQKNNADVLFAIMKVASQLDSNELNEYKTKIREAIKKYIESKYGYEATDNDLESIMTNEHWNSYEGLNIISELITAAVDNAKDQVLCNINGGKNFLSLYVAGVALGIDFKELSNILMSDVAKNISQIMQGNFFENIEEMRFVNIINNADKNKVDVPLKILDGVEDILKTIISPSNFKKEYDEIKGDKNFDPQYVIGRILFERTHHSNSKRKEILEEINKMSSDDESNKNEIYKKIAYSQLYDDIINTHRISDIKNSDKKSFNDIKRLAEMSNEMSSFSSFANLRSIKKTAQDILAQMNSWSNIFMNQVKNIDFKKKLTDINKEMSKSHNGRLVKEGTVDVEMLVLDEEYLNNLIKLQGDKKTFINPLYLLRYNSDYWASFKAQVLAMIASKTLSNTFRISDIFASAAIDRIGKGQVKDVYSKAGKFIISKVMNDYLYNIVRIEIDGSLINMDPDTGDLLSLSNIQVPVSLGSNYGNLLFVQTVEHILDTYTSNGLITVNERGEIRIDNSEQSLKEYLYRTSNKSMYMDMGFSCYRLNDACYDSKSKQTIENMRMAFAKIQNVKVPIKMGDKYMTFGQMMSLYNSVMYLNDGERSFRPMLRDYQYYMRMSEDYSKFSDNFDYDRFSKDENAIDLFVEMCIPIFRNVNKAVDYKGKVLYIQTNKMDMGKTPERYERKAVEQTRNYSYEYDNSIDMSWADNDQNDINEYNNEDFDNSIVDDVNDFRYDENVLGEYNNRWERKYATLSLHYNAFSSVPVSNAPEFTKDGKFNIGLNNNIQAGKYFKDEESGLEIFFGKNGYLSGIAVPEADGTYKRIIFDGDGSFDYNDKNYNFDEYLKKKDLKIQVRYSLNDGIVPDVDSIMAQLKDMLNIGKC